MEPLIVGLPVYNTDSSLKAPGIQCFVAGSIPAVTPRYCMKKNRKMLLGAQKIEKKKFLSVLPPLICTYMYSRVQ